MLPRRQFIAGLSLLPGLPRNGFAYTAETALKISIPDKILGMSGRPEAIALAQTLGFDGIEITLESSAAGRLNIDDDDILTQYVDQWRLHQIELVALSLNDASKSNVTDAIRLAGRVGVKLIVAPGQVTPQAKLGTVTRAYAITGLNATGDQVAGEIRRFGHDHVRFVRLQARPNFDLPPVIRALQEIAFAGYLSLEMPASPTNLPAGLRKNLGFIRSLERQS